MIDVGYARALTLIRGRLTPSKANLADACPPSMALPWTGSGNAWQGLGKVIHRYLELLQRARNGELELRDEWGERIPPEALERLARAVRAMLPAEHRAALEAIDLTRLPLDPGLYRVGEAFAYNWRRDTGRRLEVTEERGYAGQYDPAEEIPGTTDVRGDTGPDDPRGQAVIIIDYKLWAPDSPSLLEDLQLLLYALAAARAFGYERAIIAKVRIRDGKPSWEQEELDSFALDAAAARVQGLMERVLALAPLVGGPSEPPEVVEAYSHGHHCNFCPAIWGCPSKMRLAGALVSSTRPGQASLLPLQFTRDNQEKAYRTLVAAEALLDKLWESFGAYARQAAEAGHPVQAGNGHVYAPARRERETFDPLSGAFVLAEAFDVETARHAIQRTSEMTATTIEASVEDLLERARRDVGLTRKMQAVLQDGERLGKRTVLAAVRRLLRERGASAITVTRPLTRHRTDALVPETEALDDMRGLLRLASGEE